MTAPSTELPNRLLRVKRQAARLAELQALQAATIVAADLIDAPLLGRIAPDMLADIVGVPGNPLDDITLTQRVKFVMKDGKVHKR